MTAEIAVYNKTAVALAADSAVTISGAGKHKIYNGAEKLFSLSKHHPIGLMVYGSGDLCSAPWELVIKAYRSQLNSDSFDTLEDYVFDFFKYLENDVNIVSDGMREEYQFTFLSDGVFQQLLEAFHKEKDVGYWSTFNIITHFEGLEEFCIELLEVLSGAEFLDGFSEDDLDVAIESCDKFSPFIIKKHLEVDDETTIPPSLVKVINSIFATILCKKSDIGNITGIVIAGYGDKDYYPKVISYDVCGFANGKLRKSHNKAKCSDGGISGVTPFAQDDEVSAFMQGCSGQLIESLHTHYKKAIVAFLEGIDSVISEEIPSDKCEMFQNKVVGVAKKTLSEIDNEISNYMHENYVRKVIEMVRFLPKQDLAYMAESLVNLTAFKRKVSEDSETVGGPIDVAVISKADGFIWVRRKHYFDKDLNHHFFARS